jgi:hypothetical protein
MILLAANRAAIPGCRYAGESPAGRAEAGQDDRAAR